ncbi:TetR/AcrR family transcriptional regulator [Kiloniella antarctica]|uniref:TetR/AcrR family transcriptional regulator n=1 Tax=Kiloniella antarctica TaxID=1550907 RepID=A0ABW5BMS1_9PROT
MQQKLSKREETRKRMLAAAGRSFRSYGYAGIGVDGIAKEAGVTSGAFYAHFGSKDGAFSSAVVEGLDEVIEGVPHFQLKHGVEWVQAFADYYLGQPHREDLACGCAMTTLTPEVARSNEGLQKLYEQKMTKIAMLIAEGLSGATEDNRIARAWAMLAVLIGGLNITRAMDSPALAQNIAEAVKVAAVKTAGQAQVVV